MKLGKILAVAAILVGVSLVLGGCGSKQASTPKDAVVNMAKAIETNDKALFLASISVQAGMEDAAGAMFDAMTAMQKLSQEMKKAYGDKAVGGFGKDAMPSSKDIAAKVKIEEKGDSATATLPDQASPMPLVKKDGHWKVDFGSRMPPGEKAGTIAMGKAMAQCANNARKKIGKSGYDAEKINKELGEEMMKSMMASMEKNAPKKD